MTTQNIGQMELLPVTKKFMTTSLPTGISGLGWIARPKLTGAALALEQAQDALTAANDAQADAMGALCAARGDATAERDARAAIAAAEERQDLTYERFDLLRFLYRDGTETRTRAVVEHSKTDAARGLEVVVLRFDREEG